MNDWKRERKKRKKNLEIFSFLEQKMVFGLQLEKTCREVYIREEDEIYMERNEVELVKKHKREVLRRVRHIERAR